MDEVLDLIMSNESPSELSDAIKNILFAKAAEKIDELKPSISDSLFDSEEE
jgi:hypothetical protein